ncbi:subtype B tannase [Mitsuokella jalaludinii]|mgnify:CR=1 FL=1|uniref:subtype B tannase n=1 Tax=Mitsuokella jalaludinii TaxID=187979 RepID=UPI000B243A6B|nr:subtype B tannase [Mitsuokella jalaludinii]MCQ1533482.1 S9 family peptidase [Mitsuokella jalaludinii]
MNLKQYVLTALAVSALTMPWAPGVTQAAAADAAAQPAAEPAPQAVSSAAAATAKTVKADAPIKVKQAKYSLKFNAKNYTKETLKLEGQDVAFRAYRDVVYTAKPASVASESMSIFIPEAYFTKGGTVNGYTAKTAPIFLPNGVGGYMPGDSKEPSDSDRMSGGANASLVALSKGYVVAAPAVRGRTTVGDDGKTYVGKAPALLVDYKAAVRYLRHNRHRLPAGNTDRIISDGTSAGGALSALLGATGNSKEYDAELRAIGAAHERDDIFAAMAYCPITDLDHADMAYEWMFNGVNEAYQHSAPMSPLLPLKAGSMPGALKVGDAVVPLGPGPVVQGDSAAADRPDNAPVEDSSAVEMTQAERVASDQLKALFPDYVNSLGLKDRQGRALTLDEDGTGSFADYIKSVYAASAQSALDAGEDLSALDWLTIENGMVKDVDLAKYAAWATRLKAAPAFDKFDRSAPENDEFGTTDNTPRHFTGFSLTRDKEAGATMATWDDVRRMNPMYFIGQQGVTIAPHWRIRHGAKDRDTSMAVPALLALKLQDSGYEVDFASPWGKGHAGDYDLAELFDWADGICKAADTRKK